MSTNVGSVVAKAIQGVRALAIQAVKDSGRTAWMAFIAGNAATNVEALTATTSLTEGIVALANASTYTVPAGKRLRIQMIYIHSRGGVAATYTFRIRTTAALTGVVLFAANVSTQAGTAGPVPFPIPDGWELEPGQQFCLSSQTGATGVTGDVTILGFLY